jgi:hypothetical protein
LRILLLLPAREKCPCVEVFSGAAENWLIKNKGEFVMKKLLVLLLVLGVASMAQAAFVLSVDGDTGVEQKTMAPSEWIELDIAKTAGLFGIGDLAIRVTGPGHLAWGGNDPEAPDLGPINYIGNATNMDVPTDFVGVDGAGNITHGVYPYMWDLPFTESPISTDKYLKVFGGNNTYNTEGPYTLLDNVWFHCDGLGEVIIDLVAASSLREITYATSFVTVPPPPHWTWSVSDYVELPGCGVDTVLDTITITQIPEPMTMSLLGLGGLALLRRRRA